MKASACMTVHKHNVSFSSYLPKEYRKKFKNTYELFEKDGEICKGIESVLNLSLLFIVDKQSGLFYTLAVHALGKDLLEDEIFREHSNNPLKRKFLYLEMISNDNIILHRHLKPFANLSLVYDKKWLPEGWIKIKEDDIIEFFKNFKWSFCFNLFWGNNPFDGSIIINAHLKNQMTFDLSYKSLEDLYNICNEISIMERI